MRSLPFSHTETLMGSVRELSEISSNRSTDWNAESERSRSSGQRSDMQHKNLMKLQLGLVVLKFCGPWNHKVAFFQNFHESS